WWDQVQPVKFRVPCACRHTAVSGAGSRSRRSPVRVRRATFGFSLRHPFVAVRVRLRSRDSCGNLELASQEFELLIESLEGSEGRKIFLPLCVDDDFGKANEDRLAFSQRQLHQCFRDLFLLSVFHFLLSYIFTLSAMIRYFT